MKVGPITAKKLEQMLLDIKEELEALRKELGLPKKSKEKK